LREEKTREDQVLISQLRRHHARPCIAHFLEAPLRINPGTFLDPSAGGHGEGQIPPGRKFGSLLAPAGMVGYNQLFVTGMGGMVLFFQSRQACAFHGADLSLSKLRSCEPRSVAGSGRSGDLQSVPSRALAPL